MLDLNNTNAAYRLGRQVARAQMQQPQTLTTEAA